MRHLDGLSEFCAVVDAGSFTRAAERLDVSASFVSRRVADLENRLGVRLLHRTTRRVNLTDLGLQYYERATSILDDISALESDLSEQQGTIKGRIRITAGGLFGETVVAAAIAEFARAHPDIEIEYDVTDRRVDLVREGYDLAIRHRVPSDPDLVVRRLGARRMITCASPAYLVAQGTPSVPEDLSQHTCLTTQAAKWTFRKNDKDYDIKVTGRWTSNNGPALVAAATRGLGIVRLADTYLAKSLDTGALTPVLEDFETLPQDTVITYPSRERLPLRMRAMIDHLVQSAGGQSSTA